MATVRDELKRVLNKATIEELPYDVSDKSKHTLSFLKCEVGCHTYLNANEKDQLVLLRNFAATNGSAATPERINDCFVRYLEGLDKYAVSSNIIANQCLRLNLKAGEGNMKSAQIGGLNSWLWWTHCSSAVT